MTALDDRNYNDRIMYSFAIENALLVLFSVDDKQPEKNVLASFLSSSLDYDVYANYSSMPMIKNEMTVAQMKKALNEISQWRNSLDKISAKELVYYLFCYLGMSHYFSKIGQALKKSTESHLNLFNNFTFDPKRSKVKTASPFTWTIPLSRNTGTSSGKYEEFNLICSMTPLELSDTRVIDINPSEIDYRKIRFIVHVEYQSIYPASSTSTGSHQKLFAGEFSASGLTPKLIEDEMRKIVH